MTQTSIVSNKKIIIVVALISLILISALFLYHHYSRKQLNPTAISSDIGVIFPIPREIKPFDLMTKDQQKFTLKDFYNHWTLLFFGFTHCASICPTTLDMLNRAYILSLHKAVPNLQVVLVSLDPERDNIESLTTYTHSFNSDFIGVTGSLPELRKLQSQLGIYSAKDTQSSENNYQLQHTASILLINPAGKWTALFKYGLNPKEFTDALIKSLEILS